MWYSLYTVFHSGKTLSKPVRQTCSPILHRHLSHGLVVVSVVIVLEEQFLNHAVSGECDGCNTEAREGALEAVPPREGAGVPPLFTVGA